MFVANVYTLYLNSLSHSKMPTTALVAGFLKSNFSYYNEGPKKNYLNILSQLDQFKTRIMWVGSG